MNDLLKQLWLRIALRGVRYGDARRALNAIYWLNDPWEMSSPREVFRFEETNRIIYQQFGRVDRLLEVGCGEGHQSERLIEICNSLDGIDVSAHAVARAKARCPRGNFCEGNVFEAPVFNERSRYDLVVGCEVLYYMQDIPRIVKRMSDLGSACLITYYDGQSKNMDPYFSDISERQKAIFCFDKVIWKAVWWSS